MIQRIVLIAVFTMCALFALPTVQAADVNLTAADGTRLHAIYETTSRGTASGFVVLVHAEKHSAQDWSFLSSKLTQAGFNVLAVDLRYHGGSTEAEAPATLTDEHYQAMVQDVEAGAAFLRTKGAKQIDYLGAELGATLAMRVAATSADARNLVLLSPCMNVHGMNMGEDVKKSGERAILFAVSTEDRLSSKTCLVLETQAHGPKHLEIYEGAGTGATMLNREPALEGLVVSWLLGVNDMQLKQIKESIELQEGGTIETTGPKLPWQE